MHVADFKVESNSAFEMSDLGLLHHYLGIQFKQCDGGIALCQTKYIEALLHVDLVLRIVSLLLHLW